MTDPQISAVIPVRNGGRFIAQAIDSVLVQKEVVVECIVVDDGSEDDTSDVLDRFGDKIRRVETPQVGVARARNRGAEVAMGRQLAFLDSDDVWLPRKSALQLRALADDRLGLSFTALHLIDENGRFKGRIPVCEPTEALKNTLLLEKPFMSGIGSSALVKREAFEKVGGFDERLSTSADCGFACKVALRWDVHALARPMVLYRLHPAQMHNDPAATQRDMMRIFDELFNDPDLPSELQRLRRRAEANLGISLAGSYLRQRHFAGFIRHVLRASIRRPDRLIAAVGRLSRPGGGESRAV